MARVQTIGLTTADLDRPLYRIYSLRYLEDALHPNGGKLALVRPRVWEDPFEDPCERMMMMAMPASHRMLSEYLQPAYAQCWSMDGQSDALLRAYSRVKRDPATNRNTEASSEGARVRSTPRLIINALEQHQAKAGAANLELYVAKVSYAEEPLQPIIDALAALGPTKLGEGFARAKSLTFKRMAFSHEQEVRVIALAQPGTTDNVIYVDININEVFQEVVFDPRLIEFERKEREAWLRSLGYTGDIGVAASYMTTYFQIPLPKHWDEIDAAAAGRGTPT